MEVDLMVNKKIQSLSKQASKQAAGSNIETGRRHMNKISMKRCVSLLLCLSFFWIILSPVTVKAEEPSKKIVKIGLFEDTYNKVDADGEISGYGYEYIQKIAGYNGWTCEYVKADWSDCFTKLQNGEIDILNGISYTEDRVENMLFSDAPMGKEQYYIFADITDTNVSVSDLHSFDGKNIGVFMDNMPEVVLNEWERKNNLHTQHVNISTMEDILGNLETHKMDCFVSVEEPWDVGNISPILNIGSSDVYFAVNKERTDIKEELDSAMRRIATDHPFYMDDLYKQFLHAPGMPVFNDEEQIWLKEHNPIRMGYISDDSGISSMRLENGNLTGVINDYINYARNCVMNQTLEFELRGFESLEDEIEALQSGEIDMIFKIPQNPYQAEQMQLTLSDTVMTIPFTAITCQEHFNADEENCVAIAKDDPEQKWYIDYSYPNWKIVECDSTKDAEKLLKKGKVDCMISRAGQVRKYLKDNNVNTVLLENREEISFAVNRNDKILISILNKTLNVMPTNMLTNALSMHENRMQKITTVDFVRDNLVEVVTSLVILSLFIMSILLLLSRSKKAEAKAKEAMYLAEEANAAKSNFLFNMSHDIRTPMNAILGFTELAEKKVEEPEMIRDYLDKIQVSGKGMMLILDKVLEIARIESGKVILEESPQKCSDILNSCITMMSPEIEKKHLLVTVEEEIHDPYTYFDEARITEIILNILSNAIKYTADGGKIHCTVRQYPHPDKGWIYQELSVLDNGIGMSEEFQKHIFDLFTRENSSTVSGVPGTGLGMGIVKKLIDLMNGTIEVKSEQGKGTTVTFKVPLRLATFEETQPKYSSMPVEKEQLCGKHILLAEDNDLNAEIAITLLEEEGVKVDRAIDGVQCVEKLERAEKGYYALILMDIQMPNLDGYQATKRIRELNDKEKANIPIIAMTANAFTEDKEKVLEVGMNDFATKPINMDILMATMLKYI